MKDIEEKELILKKRVMLNARLDSAKDLWSIKKVTYRLIILGSLVGLLALAFTYHKDGTLTPLDVISISIMTSTLHMSIRNYVDSKLDYEFETQKVMLLLSGLDELEKELDQ